MKANGHQMTATAIAQSGFYGSFGDAVRRARETAGLTQADLAGQVGLSRPAIANIELGRQGVLLHAGLDIAAALSVSLMDLLAAALEAARREEIAHLEARLAALKTQNGNGPKQDRS